MVPSGTIFEKFITIPADVLDKFKWTCYTLKHEYLCAGQNAGTSWASEQRG